MRGLLVIKMTPPPPRMNINPKQRGIYPHIDRSTRKVQDGVCNLIIYLYAVLRRVMLLMMWLMSNFGEVLLAQYLGEGFDVFCMGISGEYMGWCTYTKWWRFTASNLAGYMLPHHRQPKIGISYRRTPGKTSAPLHPWCRKRRHWWSNT